MKKTNADKIKNSFMFNVFVSRVDKEIFVGVDMNSRDIEQFGWSIEKFKTLAEEIENKIKENINAGSKRKTTRNGR